MLMDLYLIRRRHAFQPDDVKTTVARANAEAERMSDQLRHIRSYLLDEGDGSLGTTCVYEAIDPDAIRAHARASGLPASEITAVANTAISRADPVPAV
jgi:hypothetical protein